MSTRSRRAELRAMLADGRLHRAGALAAGFGTSVRTIYRDMAALAADGFPVAGTPGAGYRAQPLVPLPAMALTMPELEALQTGLAIVAAAGDDDLRRAAQGLAHRLETLPADALPHATLPPPAQLPLLRRAIAARQKITATPVRQTPGGAAVTLHPLRLDHWQGIWRLVSWSAGAATFRSDRVDRLDAVALLPELFVDAPGQTLDDYLDRASDP